MIFSEWPIDRKVISHIILCIIYSFLREVDNDEDRNVFILRHYREMRRSLKALSDCTMMKLPSRVGRVNDSSSIRIPPLPVMKITTMS